MAQRVGLVLSGGGASGVAHIGVIKALEENNIPIDYIAGTSIGALVGAFYAAGYSPEEMEQIFTSEAFINWSEGKLDDKYIFYLRQKEEDASWITIKLALDTTIETSLPTNLVSPVSIDYALMEIFTPPIAAANYTFDSLFVPFRCVAADIVSKKPVIFKNGNLSSAVRASMSYPFYLKPLKMDSMLLFDGGIYNNFPADVMYHDFLPDFIIGSNVSSNFPMPDEDNLVSQLKVMLVNNTNYNLKCDEGIILNPMVDDYPTFNFSMNKEIIEEGYNYTLQYIDSIKTFVKRTVDKNALELKRKAFKSKCKPLIFDEINIEGVTLSQQKYIRKSLYYKHDTISVSSLKSNYMKLASEDKIKQIYPEAVYDKDDGFYELYLKIKKEKDLFVSFGGNVSSRPINEGFIGLKYHLLGKTATTLMANTYFGKYYSSALGGIRFDFPTRLPFYIKGSVTLNKWNYFKSSFSFFEDDKPSYLINRETFGEGEIGFPVAYKGKIELGGNMGYLQNDYYQTDNFTSKDTADITRFDFYSGFLKFERNSLDKKQYASKGSYLEISGRYVSGKEETVPGSTSFDKTILNNELEWVQFKAKYDKYFNKRKKLRFGFMIEIVYSNQPFFKNYTATILAAPAFQPISESLTLFQERFRAHSYFAGGLRSIFDLWKNVHFRLEGYVFQPYQQILKNPDLTASYGPEFSQRYYIASAMLVYHSPLGPIALNLNYYDQTQEQFSFMFHFGYILFNKKALK
ncbi:MAG: patatin-like phospholipase family protein [Vicingaceae bacterium]